MTDIQATYSGDLSLDVFSTLGDASPAAANEIIHLAWRHGLRPIGTFTRWHSLELGLCDVVRLAALGVPIAPDEFSALIQTSAEPDTADLEAIAAAATVALRDPRTMRWISANRETVARSRNWQCVVPGLTGVTVSVPLAEEALINLMKAKCEFPRDISGYVQLNVWFSRRFSARLRRRVRGKRIRIRERAATTRAWSHARTALGHQVPFEWSSIHGRGVGRPLDHWSVELLSEYVTTFDNTYDQAVPAVVASLYAIAAGSIGHRPTEAAATANWDVLPYQVEERARRLLGLSAPSTPDAATARALASATTAIGASGHGWGEFVATAFTEGRGIAAAADGLINSA